MTKQYHEEVLDCPSCGASNIEYTVIENGHHLEARSKCCDRFIKFLPKKNKYRTKAYQEILWDKTNGRCGYCGERLNPFKYDVDHMTPPDLGGTNDIENLINSCQRCNRQKGKKTVNQYRQWLIERGAKTDYIFYFELKNLGMPKHISELFKNLL